MRQFQKVHLNGEMTPKQNSMHALKAVSLAFLTASGEHNPLLREITSLRSLFEALVHTTFLDGLA